MPPLHTRGYGLITGPLLHNADRPDAVRLVVVIQYAEAEQYEQLSWKPTFIVVVFHSEDSSPGGTCVVNDSFDIQWLDCEGVDDPD